MMPIAYSPATGMRTDSTSLNRKQTALTIGVLQRRDKFDPPPRQKM
jgi:hypothetical protein